MDGLSYFALAILFFVVLILAYGMIAIHDIPYLIAKARNHPHQDAIHAGGWVSLFTAAVMVSSPTIIALLCIASLPAWLLVTGRPQMQLHEDGSSVR